MASIDWSAIEAVVNNYIDSPAGYKATKEVVDKIMLGEIKIQSESGTTNKTPRQAADMFIQVLKDTINSAGLSSGVTSAISKGIVRSIPYKNGNGYSINVYWQEDLSRPSLLNDIDDNYDRLVNLAELYDTGVDHTMKRVWGTWHGKKVGSKTDIKGTHFMDEAVRAFMDSYGSEYGVKDIVINRDGY